MKRNYLSLPHTGWFYLVIAVWGVCYWIISEGGLNSINQLNRDKLYQVVGEQSSEASLIRLTSDLQVSNFNTIVSVLESAPSVPVALIGEPSLIFIEKLESYLQRKPRQAVVALATQSLASNAAVEFVPNTWNDWGRYLNPVRFADSDDIEWRIANGILYTPALLAADDGVPLIWYHNEKAYLTLFGELLRQLLPDGQFQIDSRWEVSLALQQQSIPTGVNGVIYSGGLAAAPVGITDYVANPQPEVLPRLIIISVDSGDDAQAMMQTVARLLDGHYLYRGVGFTLLQWGLLLFGIILAWVLRRLTVTRQLIFIISYTLLVGFCQYVAFTQNQWLAWFPNILLVGLTWLVIVGYQREYTLVEKLNDRHNQLLGEALPLLFQSQKLERLQPLLAQTFPDISLADKVFDLALRAEATNNRPLAKALLGWIRDSHLKHEASENKLMELEAPEDASGLDQTMVIGPGQNSTTTNTFAFPRVENFGRYKVEGILGKGAMGIVYQGVDPKINRHVAIKTLQLSDSVDGGHLEETKARFFREAETAGNLSHANIVTIYDVGEEEELGYIAMDLLTGAPLSEFVKSDSLLPVPLLYQLMIQITDALDYAHKQNVVHRDIKPGNIIFDDEIQRVTVTDFGIAYMSDNSKTRTGTIMGSPYYMSPEQVLGKQVDGRSDIFSLGVTFYQLLSGQLPFQGESIASVAYHITKTKQDSVRQKNNRLPASAARITNKAMHKDKTKRYQTMQEFKLAIISALKRDFKKAPIV